MGILMLDDASGRAGRREAAVGVLFQPWLPEAVAVEISFCDLRLREPVVKSGCEVSDIIGFRLRLLPDVFGLKKTSKIGEHQLVESLRTVNLNYLYFKLPLLRARRVPTKDINVCFATMHYLP
jgi:hypothetical protein